MRTLRSPVCSRIRSLYFGVPQPEVFCTRVQKVLPIAYILYILTYVSFTNLQFIMSHICRIFLDAVTIILMAFIFTY